MLPQLLALAAPASAFLVLPDVLSSAQPEEPEGAFKILPVAHINPLAIPPTAESQTINVPCAECHGDDATVRFDIKVHDTNKLLINGFEVYPSDDPPPAGDLRASVSSMPGSEGVEEALDWVIWWQVEEVDKDQGMMILDWHLGVGTVGGITVSNVGLAMKLIVGPNGEVFVADAMVPEPAAQDGKPPCDGLWCAVEELWNSLFEGGMGCHQAHEEMSMDEPEFVVVTEHVETYDGEDDVQYGKLFMDLASHILLPVIMGIVSGVGAAVVIMFICSLVAFVFRKLAGRETQHSWTLVPSQVVIIEEEDEGDEEKSGLMDGQAPPPAYEGPVEKE